MFTSKPQPATTAAATFNSKLDLSVYAIDKDGEAITVGETPSAKPLAIPANALWFVSPEVTVSFEALVAEISAKQIPGVRLLVSKAAEWPSRAKGLGTLTGLRMLILKDDGVSDAGMDQLAKLQQLESLELSHTQVGDGGLAHVAKLQKLSRLDLRATHVTDAGMVQLTKLPALRVLSLEGTQVTDAGLKHLAKLTGLQKLVLGENVTDAGVAKLQKALPKCRIPR